MADSTPPTPLFESPAQNGTRRRLLLVSYFFPPDTAIGALRWQMMAPHFANRGWDIDVITRDFPKAQLQSSALQALPSGVRVFGAPEREPAASRAWRAVHRVARRLQGRGLPVAETVENTGAPRRPGPGVIDPLRHPAAKMVEWADFLVWTSRKRSWAGAAARLGIDLARSTHYAMVVSSGPPHAAHEVARRIAMHARIPYAIDLRDPWAAIEADPNDPHEVSQLWFAASRTIEAACVRHAALVIMNTDASRDLMRARYPAAAARIITVRNGSDDDPLPSAQPSERFTIRFAGSVILDRDPRLIFPAVAEVVRRHALTPARLAIELIGNISPERADEILASAKSAGLEGFVTVGGRRSRAEAMAFLAGATMLLNPPQYMEKSIPAKIYEYVRFDAWLLALAPKHGAVADLLHDTDADVVDPGDVAGMTARIDARVREFFAGIRPRAINHDGRFDRRMQSDVMLDALETIVRSTPAA